MYATTHTVTTPHDRAGPGDDRRRLFAVLCAQPGVAGVYQLERLGPGGGTLLALWLGEHGARRGAELALDSLGAPPHTATERYDVIDDWSGLAMDEEPVAAVTVHFDGPMSAVRYAAGERAHRERIRPAIEAVPGFVRGISLWQAASRALSVVQFSTSFDGLAALEQAVNSTTLLPGEDPALLTGPDRVEVHRVIRHSAAPAPTH